MGDPRRVYGAFLAIPTVSLSAVAVAANGNLLAKGIDNASSSNGMAICTLDTEGVVLKTKIPAPTFNGSLNGIAVTSEGDFLMLTYSTIFRLSPAFNFLDAFPVPLGSGSSVVSTGIRVDQQGQILSLLLDHNIRGRTINIPDSQGNLMATLGPYSFEIQALETGGKRHLYYAKAGGAQPYFGPSRIVELDEKGVEVGSFLAPIRVDGMTILPLDQTPVLRMNCLDHDVFIQWPAASTDYQLQSAAATFPPTWIKVNVRPTIVEETASVKMRAESNGMHFWLVRTSQ